MTFYKRSGLEASVLCNRRRVSNKLQGRLLRSFTVLSILFVDYLVGDFDVESKDDDNKHVVKDTDSSHDDVDDLECRVPDDCKIHVCIHVYRRYDLVRRRGQGGCGEVVPRIAC